MTDSLRWKSSIQPDGGERISEAQGRRREPGSEGCAEQSRDLMDKNRMRGLPGRTSERGVAKSAAIKGREGKSGGDAVKAVDLTSGGLRRVRSPGLNGSARPVTAAQKSAEGIVAGSPAKARMTDRVRRTATLMRTRRQNNQLELALEPAAKGEAQSAGALGPKPARRVPSPNARRLGSNRR